MPQLIDYRRVFSSRTLTVGDYRCRQRRCGCGVEEVSHNHSVVLPRAGLFVKHVRGQEVVADANQVVFFNAGEPYRVSHPTDAGDNCTTFEMPATVLVDAIAEHDRSVLERQDRPFQQTHGASSRAAFLLHHRLLQALGEAEARDALLIEEIGYRIIDAVLAHALVVKVRGKARAQTQAAHRDLAEATKRRLAAGFCADISLEELAASVYASPFHLARLFRHQTGMSIHRYLMRLRLRHALDRIADGQHDLSRLALQCGFYDHSHLTNAFRAEFKITPSLLRKTASLASLRQMSRNLQA